MPSIPPTLTDSTSFRATSTWWARRLRCSTWTTARKSSNNCSTPSARTTALEGISKLLNTIKIIKSKLNPRLEIEGFLLTMYDSRLRLANQIYDEVKRHFQELVFKTVIQRNVKLSESPSHGLPVILYDAESTGTKNHLALAKEIINKN